MNEIAPRLPQGEHGFKPWVPVYEIVNAILYKLKIGVKWEQLPVKALFHQNAMSRNTVYHHYRKWGKIGTWLDCWIEPLAEYRSMRVLIPRN